MTKEQILGMDNLAVAEERPGMFVHIHAKEGFLITDWVEGDDIMNYTSSVCLFMPIRDSYTSEYRTITLDEDKMYQERLIVAIEKEKRNREDE
jgi:hypothetical protein